MDAACVVCDAAPASRPGRLYCRDCQPAPRTSQPTVAALQWVDRSWQCWADACGRRGVTPAGLCESHRDLFREPA